jgi:hypothetical protein
MLSQYTTRISGKRGAPSVDVSPASTRGEQREQSPVERRTFRPLTATLGEHIARRAARQAS